MNTITTNELKKGDRVTLKCGWQATLEDNKKGNIRLATVEGVVTEMGSIYAHDILLAQKDGQAYIVKPTDAQKKQMKTIGALFR